VKISDSRTYKFRIPHETDHAIYFTIVGGDKTEAFFINSKELKSFELTTALMTAYSRQLQLGRTAEELIADMKKTFDPKGSYPLSDGTGRIVNSSVHHLGLILEEHIKQLKKEKEMQETNFLCVRRWMQAVDQDTPPAPFVPIGEGVLELRKELIREEAKEAGEAFDNLLNFTNMDVEDMLIPIQTASMTDLVKELADILVVTYGAFAAIGVDADKAMNIVMHNNFGKVEHGVKRDDGKIVVDAETKERLKNEVTTRLKELLSHGINS